MTTNEQKRAAFKGHLTTAINKLKEEIKAEVLDEYKIRSLLEQVETKYKKVEDVTVLLQANMEAVALEEDINKMDLLENQVIEAKVYAKTLLEKLKDIKHEPSHLAQFPQQPPQPSVSVKLPDVTLQEFDGNEENFPAFIDQFNALIHNNAHLSNIEKFGYLKGAAKVSVIQYFPLTEQNYLPALNRLKEEYGDEDFIAKKHMKALLDMNKRRKPSDDVELQEFYNFVECKLACLEALKRPLEQTNEMLITLITRQLPRKLKNKVAQLDSAHTTVSAVMNIIKNYIKTARKMNYREESDSEQETESYNYNKPKVKFKRSNENRDDFRDGDEDVPISSAASLPVLSQRKKTCVFCRGNHYPLNCQSVVDVAQRKEILRRNNRCYNCLASGHRVTECRNEGRCRTCQRKHHTAICTGNQSASNNQGFTSGGNSNADNSYLTTTNQGLSTSSTWEPIGSVLLEIAQAVVKKPGGSRNISVNIFFDKGSQLSYCTTQLRDKLGLNTIYKDVMETNTFGNSIPKITASDVVNLQIIKGNYSKEISVHVSDHICNPLPSFRITRKQHTELKGLELASNHCKFEGSHEISILIGSDLYWEFIENDMIKTSWGAGAVKTKLGWLLSGPMSNMSNSQTNVHFTTSKIIQSLQLDEFHADTQWINQELTKCSSHRIERLETITDDNIQDTCHRATAKENKGKVLPQISALSVLNIGDQYTNNKKQVVPEDIKYVDEWFQYKCQSAITDKEVELRWFWDLEHIGIIPEDQEPSTEQNFLKNIKYNKDDKRYEVQFPCKHNLIDGLPDNFHICKQRLDSLLRKLNKPENGETLKAYVEVICKQLQEDVIEEVSPGQSTDTVIHYLPHHGVVKKDKLHSVRIVYDGSARSHKKSLSLNECLEAGPCLVNNLAAVLMRFRMFDVAITADISKAFLQLSLHEDDRDLTRFIWKDNGDPDNSLKIYRFKRVPFGLTSSPFLLHATIIHHLSQYKNQYPEIVSKLLQSFYVDDMLTGTDSHNEAIELVNKCDSIMKEASFKLSKWISNSSQVLIDCKIPDENKISETNVKILGIFWNTDRDHFTYNTQEIVNLASNSKPTKRNVLKILQKVYDPLGMVSPFLITAKILFQELCKLNLSWNEELPENLLIQWENWTADLHKLDQIRIPRAIKKTSDSSFELIGFSDASKCAYAAVVYIRCISKEVTTSLVITKSRVAPMKNLTIPRLELLGAVLLARLVQTVKEFLNKWKFGRIMYFTDSLNVLYWINGPKKWNRFISKRLEEINQISEKHQWNHCDGNDNPADYPTRGLTVDQLKQSTHWMHGPAWLSNPSYEPHNHLNSLTPTRDCLQEEVKSLHVNAAVEASGLSRIVSLKDYSNLNRLINTTSFIYYFIEKLIKKRNVSHTDVRKLAEIQWIKDQQRHYYTDVISYLKGEVKRPSSSIKNQLDLFLDEDGVIRCAGRFKYATLPYNAKYPILLPKKSHLTTLIIKDRHKLAKHAGIKSTLAEVRTDFWLPRGKRMVENIVRSCIVCRRFTAKPYMTPGPPPLPQIRLSEMPPFTNTGIDFAGPLFCRERGSERAYKSYIALYTCASSRAIHLELVPSLSSISFMNSLIRFISTRGIPHIIISDNAKTFKKTAEDLNCMITRSPTKEYVENKKITWLFYLEKSPWWGGFIERLVQSVKSILRKTLYRTFLSYDEMSTLLKEIEAVLNSRPITHMFEEIEDPLTPAHLLIGKRLTKLPATTSFINDTDKTNDYREKILKVFQQRWRDEYLSQLQDYHISQQRSKGVDYEPMEGEVVIMKENTPRSMWKLAKVQNTHRGRDGKIRSIEIKKPNGNLVRRPPQLLIPLEGKLYAKCTQ